MLSGCGNTKVGMASICAILFSLSAFADSPGTYFVPEKGTDNRTENVTARSGAERRKVAFLGGSITEMDGFRPRVMKMLRAKHPDVDFVEIAAGLSSTCSDTAAFRFAEDVLSQGVPDLLIVDAAVNDEQDGRFDRKRMIRGMEGVVRRALLSNPRMSVIVVLFVNRNQYEQLMKGNAPLSYAVHSEVAKHYGVGLADVGSALVASAKAGGGRLGELQGLSPDSGRVRLRRTGRDEVDRRRVQSVAAVCSA